MVGILISYEFDSFSSFTATEISSLRLYVVKGFNHTLATQDLCLVYGTLPQEGMDILEFKLSSFIKKVDYAQIVAELYNTKFSDGPQQ